MADRTRKTLCIADGSPEARSAVIFAAQRSAITRAGMVLLRVIEPMDPSLWAAMGERMREELRQEALEDLSQLSQLASETTGVVPELRVLEGEIDEEIARAVDEDPDIKVVFLAAGAGRDGPGPLVKAATRGSFRFGDRAVAIMIVPSGLSDEVVLDLAR